MLATGVNASPGAAKGEVVFTAADAVAAGDEGRDVILVRPFTEADDVAGLPRRQGHPHVRGRQGLARGAGRARHGAAGGGRRRARWRSTSRPGTITRRRHRDQRGRPDRDRRHQGLRDARGRAARRARGQRVLRARARVGRRDPPARRARERRHAARTPCRRASWAPRASACAGPSTCSWPRTASPRCGR